MCCWSTGIREYPLIYLCFISFLVVQVQSTAAPSLGERRDQGPTWLVEGKNRMIYFSDMDGGFRGKSGSSGGSWDRTSRNWTRLPHKPICSPLYRNEKKSDPPTPCHLVVQRYSRRVQYETELGQ